MAPIWRSRSGIAAVDTLYARYASMIRGGAHMQGVEATGGYNRLPDQRFGPAAWVALG
jgi:hypothetical protein